MKIIDPFGSRQCEAELVTLGSRYSHLYFNNTPFNDSVLNAETYLVIGRRGSGKTALAQYFSFQTKVPGALCIESRTGEVYQSVLHEVSTLASSSRAIAIPQLVRVWDYVIWSLISRALDEESGSSREQTADVEPVTISQRIAALLRIFVEFFSERGEGSMDGVIEKVVSEADLPAIKRRAVKYSANRIIILAIDTLEQYDVGNEPLMFAHAALVEYASEFNTAHADQQIYLKVFVSGEVFPYMKEAVLLNLAKAVRHPVYLQWRPRDLLRLISWRLYRYLEERGIDSPALSDRINWEDSDDVLNKVWIPHFGTRIRNARGLEEHSWPYILRHTQMRPRQLIMICNEIANRAAKEGKFPRFSNDHVVQGVHAAELELANEIINSFSSIYPNATRIADSLIGLNMMFEGRELDSRARESAVAWPDRWSLADFREFVAALGIVGIVDRSNDRAGFVDANFEYSMNERLAITSRDMCVVHPMFYRKLRIVRDADVRVMTFTTERERE